MSYKNTYGTFRSVIIPPTPPLGQWKQDLLSEVLSDKMTKEEAEVELKRRIKAWKEWQACISF